MKLEKWSFCWRLRKLRCDWVTAQLNDCSYSCSHSKRKIGSISAFNVHYVDFIFNFVSPQQLTMQCIRCTMFFHIISCIHREPWMYRFSKYSKRFCYRTKWFCLIRFKVLITCYSRIVRKESEGSISNAISSPVNEQRIANFSIITIERTSRLMHTNRQCIYRFRVLY